MYAIFETGGKQYKVESGDILYVEKLNAPEDTNLKFETVIAIHDDKKLNVGNPYVKGASVEASVIKNGKGKKITVFTYQSKSNVKRKLGHRQPYTKIQIDGINPA